MAGDKCGCRCMAVGKCLSCSCVKAGVWCVGCYPSRLGRCANQEPVGQATNIQAAVQSTLTGNTGTPRPAETEETPLEDSIVSQAASQLTEMPSDATFSSILSPRERNSESGGHLEVDDNTCHFTLPSFQPLTPIDSNTTKIRDDIKHTYSKIVHWRPNLFRLPPGNLSKQFVDTLAGLFQSYNDGSASESFAITAAMVLPALVLQKPSRNSKIKEHLDCLQRRLALWNEGKVLSLLSEGEFIQKHLPSRNKVNNTTKHLSKRFSNLMQQGKVKDAIQLLSENNHQGVLDLDSYPSGGNKSVLDILKDKHPSPSHTHDGIITDNHNAFHPVLFDSINPDLVKQSALKTKGAAGPSGVDSSSWKRFCSSFGRSSVNLCFSLANFCKKICTEYVDPEGLSAYVACRLIPLDKNPGVRPIGIVEVVRRILGKVIMSVTKYDVIEAVGSMQLCAGMEAGCEAALHFISQRFHSEHSEGALFVDASNAFNNLNRFTALANTHSICPPLAPVLTNTYRCPSALFVSNRCLWSQEGTTQGDPLAMAMYGIGTWPLITHLSSTCSATQAWYADDSAACDTLDKLRLWWDELNNMGPSYGYFPNSSKTILLVKPQHLSKAREIFTGTDIKIESEGVKYLGGAIGSDEYVDHFTEEKVSSWIDELMLLSSVAKSYPQAAYAALTHGIMSHWTYYFRTVECSESILQRLDDTLKLHLIPSLTDRSPPGEVERDIISLPTSLGGLGISKPTLLANLQFSLSLSVCEPLIHLLSSQLTNSPDNDVLDIYLKQQDIKRSISNRKLQLNTERKTTIYDNINPEMKRIIDLASEKGASSWLTVLPVASSGFALHKSAFRDALCLRYGWSCKDLPSHCRCGKQPSIDHLLSCPMGGYPSIRHNEIRDITASYLSEVCHNVSIEPVLQTLSGEHLVYRTSNTAPDARLDVAADGVWGSRFERFFFDVRIFNPLAKTNCNGSLSDTYRKHEADKRRQYEERVKHVEHATFIPLVFSTTGGMGRPAKGLYKRLAALLSERTGTTYSKCMGLIRCKLTFALLRSSILCIRGSRSSRSPPNIISFMDVEHCEAQMSNS